jgi:hypothetical protein
MNRILNEKGQLVGFTQQNGTSKMFFDTKGSLVSREFAGRTFDGKGNFKGVGQQGLRILGEKKS